MEKANNAAASVAGVLLFVMFMFGSIPYHFFAEITYERKYQSMMQEALMRGHIMRCPGIRDLRWDCNVPIEYSDRSQPEKKERTNVQNSP